MLVGTASNSCGGGVAVIPIGCYVSRGNGSSSRQEAGHVGAGAFGLLHGLVVGIAVVIGVGCAWAPAAVGATGPLSFSAPRSSTTRRRSARRRGSTRSRVRRARSVWPPTPRCGPHDRESDRATPAWSQRQSVDNSFAHVDASCPSTTLCVAVDDRRQCDGDDESDGVHADLERPCTSTAARSMRSRAVLRAVRGR